ncbi:MAG: hypothetical protein IT447_00840 [Phycisphaerales bacterium]|nr:hypothetical protein [Phycisphaerales bacterium]
MGLKRMNQWVGGFVGLVLLVGLTVARPARAQQQNIALGRPYVMENAPNYPATTEPGDATQLTDGQYANPKETLWVQNCIVGWRNIIPIVVTIDLGSVQPISGASFSTAAWSPAGADWPKAIFVLVSENEKVWREAGDLVKLSLQAGRVPAPAVEGGNFRYTTDQMKGRGRYVRFVMVPSMSFLFCDEIEVYRGPDALLNAPVQGKVVTDMTRLVRVAATNAGVRNRLNADLAAVRARLDASNIPAGQKAALSARLDEARDAVLNVPDADPETFRTIFPMNDAQGNILRINGAISHEMGLPALSIRKVDRYELFSAFEAGKPAVRPPTISIAMMGNETRADAFLLSNATEKPIDAKIQLLSLPGGPTPPWLSLSVIPWTDTYNGTPVAAALPITKGVDGAYPVTLPVGLTSKIWISVDSSKLDAGEYKGQLLINSDSQALSVPLTLTVSPIRMGTPRLSLGMWDSANDGRFKKTTKAAIDMMRSHFVDSPWANRDVLPWPAAGDFDAAGKLIKPLETRELDAWVKLWPGARRYLVFANVLAYGDLNSSFAGTKEGSPEFDARVGSWAKALAEHLQKLKLDPSQLGLLLLDEPLNEEQEQRVIAWSKAIHAVTPTIKVFQDRAFMPEWSKPEYAKLQEQSIALSDMICPNFMYYHADGAKSVEFFENFRKSGHQLWFYQCMGPVKTFSPQVYYRELAWHAFAHQMEGIGFWAFYDKGNTTSSWNEYETSQIPYTPVFLDPNGIVSALHWEATREGIEDYEYLAMLRDAAGRSGNADLKLQADSLLNASAGALNRSTPANDDYKTNYAWVAQAKDAFEPDVYRLRVLQLLEKIQGN